MKNFLYITFLILFFATSQNIVSGQSSFGISFGSVLGDNGNIINDNVKTFRNGYQTGVFGSFGTYSIFISPGIYYKSFTIDTVYNKLNPFERAPGIKMVKGKLTLGYQTKLLTRKIKLKIGAGINESYILSISGNDQGINFDTADDYYTGYNIDIGLDFFSLYLNVSYEKSINEVLSINGNKSGLDFIILSAGVYF
ncbi:MAG TPA: hypothetical protein ENK75_06230 [Saprospiraceae bacterium]|nr:hypothetical protein [Saprospiraceae bacterium]